MRVWDDIDVSRLWFWSPLRTSFSPPLRGGEAATSIKCRGATSVGADGVVIKFHRISLRLNTTPSARAKDAPQLFLDRAASPPRGGGEKLVLNGLQTTPADINIVPNAHGTWFPSCPCDLIWTVVLLKEGAARRSNKSNATLASP